MTMKPYLWALLGAAALLLAGLGIYYALSRPPFEVSRLAAARDQSRLIVVLAEDTVGTLYAFEKKDGRWRETLRSEAWVGRGGVKTDKREGDGGTPAGVFGLQRAFGMAADPGARLPYTQLEPDHFWVDDPGSRYYNLWVKDQVPDPDWSSAEAMFEQPQAYKYAIVIEYNVEPVVRGRGSAIFLHCEIGAPTSGCVSVPEDVMVSLLKFIQPGDRIVIAASAAELQ